MSVLNSSAVRCSQLPRPALVLSAHVQHQPFRTNGNVGLRTSVTQSQRRLCVALQVAESEDSPSATASDLYGASPPDTDSISGDTSSPPAETAASSKLPLALGAVALGAAIFVFTSGAGEGSKAVTFETLQAESVPLQTALSSQCPTVIEFYAGWCEICRELLPDTLEVERAYKDQVNFVALNVDNSKWAPEVSDYNVQGIPKYVFLGADGQVQASAVGRVPRQVLEQNVDALAQRRTLPFARVRESGSELPTTGATTAPRALADPRAHG